MDKIQQQIADQKHEEAVAEGKAVILSRNIQNTISVESVPNQFEYVTGKFKVVSATRCFSNGWINLFEIEPVTAPDWPRLRFGTAEINVPPDNVRAEFFKELLAAI